MCFTGESESSKHIPSSVVHLTGHPPQRPRPRTPSHHNTTQAVHPLVTTGAHALKYPYDVHLPVRVVAYGSV